MYESNWKLLQPVEVGPVLLRNRMVMAPMETMHNHADGSVSQDMIDYYVERAKGGIGLIVVQNSAVDTIASRSIFRQLCINSDHLIPGLAKLAEACKLEGAAMVIQLGHGGRQTRPVCVPGVQIVAASPVPLDVPGQPLGVVPKEITLEEIEEVQDAFANAARRAKMAGLDGVEIHGAHGYLIGGFISPKTNRRMDKYGGPLANRVRFALEIIAKIREMVGQDFMVGFRMSADEFTPGGLTLDEAAPYAKLIADAGVDYIHVSAGTYESRPHLFPIMYYGRGHLLHLADGIKRAVKNLPIIAVGALDAEMGERALQEGKADLIAFGRGLLADPELPNKLANNRVEDIIPCILGNEGCCSRIGQGRPLRCEVNPAVGREATFRMKPAAAKKKVMVIGGGIAGMEAARTAALRGHEVTLIEKSERLGGHMVAASVPKFKITVKELLSWAEKQINKSNIKVHLNTEATPNLVKKAKPDVLIVAVGSSCKIPPIPGGDKPSVVTGLEVLLGQKKPGDEVVVCGGGTVGSEAALYIAEELKKKVTIVEMLDDILIGHELLNKTVLKDRLEAAGVTINTGWILREIRDKGVVCEDKDWKMQKIPSDTVAMCVGLEARKDAVKQFRGLAREVYAIGDCVEARRIYNAFEDAWHSVLKT
jgi:2,4-dienoyl-CoA reductase-like NADH-dependent reductase (Old Yellow Enzyme family)/thioredoxin reductase